MSLSADEVQQQLARVAGWTLVDGTIEKRFEHADFHHTMAFVNAVAWIAHREDHHPEMHVGYSQCTLRWSTHDVGGLSLRDFRCAALVDALIVP